MVEFTPCWSPIERTSAARGERHGPVCSGNLTHDELDDLVAAGRDRHRDRGVRRHAGPARPASGSRARLFVEDVAAHGAECCNYLLAVDVDMNTVDGYAMSSWETGYGDMVMTPDFNTLRLHAVAAGHRAGDGRPVLDRRRGPVRRAPRSILQHAARPARRARSGCRSSAPSSSSSSSTTTYRDAWAAGLRGPDSSHRLQHRLRDARLHPDGAAAARHPPRHGRRRACTARASRGSATSASRRSRSATTDALVTCDNHTIYKNGAKEIADQHGKSLTFMAKFNEREGNSCHIHISLRGTDGAAVFADARRAARHVGDVPHFIAGQLATMRELTLFYRAEHQLLQAIRRGQLRARPRSPGGWTTAPARCGWSATGQGCAMECRAPGGDVNQYLAVAALIAGGLYGIDNELELPEPCRGQRVHQRRRTAADHAGRGRRAVRASRRWRARRSATRSSSTT